MSQRFGLWSVRALLLALAVAPQIGLGAITTSGDTFVDSTLNTLQVGITGAGTVNVTAPGPDQFSFIGLGGNFATGAAGSVTISGAGASLVATNAINVGSLSSGTMLIQNGAVVTSLGGASPFSGCSNCNASVVGNGAGSSGTLTVTGAGSRLNIQDALNTSFAFGIANGGVSPGFGTPGAPTTGTFNVLNGATAVTVGAFLGGSNTSNPSQGNGQSASTGVVNVDGVGSTWTVQNDSVALPATVLVGLNGTGTVNITNGGRINSTFMPIGFNPGGTGTVRIDGSQSLLNLVGGDAVNGAAGVVVGFTDQTTGTLTVTNGGRIAIDATNSGSPGGGITIGGFTGFGIGSMTVSGAGSRVDIVGNVTTADGRGPGMTVGGGGIGSLAVLNGGKITILDNSSFATGGIAIAGSPFQSTPGSGTMVISGVGSEVDILSAHGGFTVGRGGVGTLVVDSGGKATGQNLSVGLQVGSVGTMTIRGAGSSVVLSGVDGQGFGAYTLVGLSGLGTLNVTDGGTLSINPAAGVPFGGLVAGGAGTQGPTDVSGTGIVNVANGGKIQITGNNSVAIVLGDHNGGSGQLHVTNGGQVIVGRPVDAHAPGDISGVYIGSRAGGAGTAEVRGNNSLLDGGIFVGVGIATDRLSNAGSGVLTVRDGGVVKADQIRIGGSGLLNGNGTIVGAVVNAGGTIAPGNSPGTLTINGSLESQGLIQIQVEGLGAGQFDVLNVVGATVLTGSTIDFIFQNGYLPKTGDSFDFLSGNTNPDPLAGVTYRYEGAGPGFLFSVDSNTGVFEALNNATPPVPEPSTALLLGLGIALLGLSRNWRLRGRIDEKSRGQS